MEGCKIRFVGDHLETDSGLLVHLSYEELRKECLRTPFKTASIYDIIAAAVFEFTDCNVIKYKCRESELFCRLEEAICQDEAYQQFKEIQVKKRKRTNQARRSQIDEGISFSNYCRDKNTKFKRIKHL